MKKNLLMTFLAIYQMSCEPKGSQPYFAFENSDYEFIADNYQDLNRTIRFRNEDNLEVRMNVLSYNLTKEFESGFGFDQPERSESYYYDNLWIELELPDFITNNNSEGCNIIYIHISKGPEGLRTELEVPTFVDPFCLAEGYSETAPFQNLTELLIQGILFTKVKIINSSNYFSFFNESEVDRIYFDFDNGIIGFDESQTNSYFRLILE